MVARTFLVSRCNYAECAFVDSTEYKSWLKYSSKLRNTYVDWIHVRVHVGRNIGILLQVLIIDNRCLILLLMVRVIRRLLDLMRRADIGLLVANDFNVQLIALFLAHSAKFHR